MKTKGLQQSEQADLPLWNRQASTIDPLLLFETWLHRQKPRFLPSTERLYRTLWGRFLEDITLKKVAFHQVQAEDIQQFLAHLEGVKRPQRERYQQVIERAYSEMLRQDPHADNPALQAAINDPYKETWRQAPDNDKTQFLTIEQAQGLIRCLQARCLILSGSTGLTVAAQWRETRDLTIVAMLLACGLRPQELADLRQRQYVPSGKEALYPDLSTTSLATIQADTYWHYGEGSVQIEGLAKRVMAVPDWLRIIVHLWQSRLGAMNQDMWLFPGSRQFSAARPAAPMNPATLARIVSKWGKQHADLILTPQRLRNTFGACMLEQGLSLPELETLMGYAPGAASAWRLQAAWIAWCAQADSEEDPVQQKSE